MDLTTYLTARWVTLVRAAVLVGIPVRRAPALVAGVLERQAPRIARTSDPDPLVLAAIISARDDQPSEPDPPPDHGPGADARRRLAALAALDPTARDAVVLLLYADLVLPDLAAALRLSPAEAAPLTRRALDQLAAGDEIAGREVLYAAAETIGVPLPPILVPTRPLRWPAVLTAAATAAIAVAVTLAVSGEPPEPTRLEADQVPSLFGYDVADARALLERRGLDVEQEYSAACEPVGLVVGSFPPIGTRFEEGDDVTVFVAAPSGTNCEAQYLDRQDAWEFVDFATGRGPAPEFADAVHVVVDGREPTVLTSRDARDRDRWGEVLAEVADATRVLSRSESGRWFPPSLSVASIVPPARNCGVPRPPGAGRRPALSLSLLPPRGSTGEFRCPLTVDLYRSDRVIDAVALYTEKSPATT